jgi:hypothetical protein
MGRRQRKRRKKNLEIEAAATAASTPSPHDLLSAGDNNGDDDDNNDNDADIAKSTSNNRILPTDRGYLQERVEQLRTLSELDRLALLRQLGYLPGNALEVVARVEDFFQGSETSKISAGRLLKMDDPVVIKLYPLALRDEADGTKARRKRRRNPQSIIDSTGTKNDESSPSIPAPSFNDDNLDNESKADAGTIAPVDNNVDDHTSTVESQNPLLEPFPTIFWVTHPKIRALVSKLELDRLGSHFEQLLARHQLDSSCTNDEQMQQEQQQQQQQKELKQQPSPLESMKRAHAAYGQERHDLILPQDWEYIRQRKWERAFSTSNRGVAGIRNPASVKCLHAHLAHYLSGCQHNIVGKWVAERVVKLLIVE